MTLNFVSGSRDCLAVKRFASKLDSLNSIFRSHMVEGRTNSHTWFTDLHLHAMRHMMFTNTYIHTCAQARMHAHIHNKMLKQSFKIYLKALNLIIGTRTHKDKLFTLSFAHTETSCFG